MKKANLVLSVLFWLVITAGSAMALPSEWGVINPTNLVASDSEMVDVMKDYWETQGTGPAYFIWTNDGKRLSWNIAWTGGHDDVLDYFSGTIALENATTNDFGTVLFEGGQDRINFESSDSVEYSAWAWHHYDGIKFTITGYEQEIASYVGFDLKSNGRAMDAANIFLGLDMQTVASLGQDEDFAMAAPVPEPATMLLLGKWLDRVSWCQ